MDIDEDKLPPGVKFSPSDEVVLVCYLMPKVYGRKLPCNKVEDKEIYGPDANPWHLFNASSTSWIDSGASEKTVYVFTRLTRKSASSTPATDKKTEHYVRKAGCGTWHGETGPRQTNMVCNGENAVIGSKKLLVYQINDPDGLGDGINLDQVGYWKMHEYSLPGFEDYVLCKITWDTSKATKVVNSKKAEVDGLCPKTLPRSRCRTKPNIQSDTHVTSTDNSANVDTPTDDNAELGVPDLGLIQDDYMVQQGSGNSMNFDCTTLPASTSCPSNVYDDSLLLDLDNFLTEFSEEELAKLDLFPDFSDEYFSAAMQSSPCSSQVLGKRKSTEAEVSGKKLCI